ncbi:hypothetical protein HGRIS_012652 [Hohenbuehelia grisea]|uniref:Ubiquitin carboxyl-terminal hydrolase n=1 Tax=Hohenbuehelia grisea TaxID=104357 RepID=A0ABR3ISY4_9AGAR
MASPHPPSGPGPSSYYPHPPPPPNSYPSYHGHSPVPPPQQYQYPQYVVQPHMNTHQNIHHQYSAPPRRGGAYAYSYGSRPGPNYPYQPPQHQQHPYSNASAPKYPMHQAYSSPYPHPPSAGPYPPPHVPWHQPPAQPQAQVLSPLPTQLSMHLPAEMVPPQDTTQVQAQPYATNVHDPIPVPSPIHAATTIETTQPRRSPSPVHELPQTSTESQPSQPSHSTLQPSPTPSEPSSLPNPPAPSSPSPSDLTNSPTITTELPGSSVWAIWSRRPRDPSQAPGIIFSTRTRPPRNVVEQALELPTPPASPQIFTSALPDTGESFGSEAVPSEHVEEEHRLTAVSLTTSAQTQPQSIPSSSSVTETTNTPIPGSPVSTANTSISLVGTPPREIKSASTLADTSSLVAIPAAEEKDGKDNLSQKISEVEPEAPPKAEVKPAAPKSWASLLSGPSSGGKARNALPTSSVVGVSIPASAFSNASGTAHVNNKPELLKLLNGGNTASSSTSGASYASAMASAAAVSPSAPPAIRPRGLINTGNMCFANSVLQVLVYCPPFHKLFAELGRLLGDGGAGGVLAGAAAASAVLGAMSDKTERPAPLVDATVKFLREFVQESKPPAGEGVREVLVNGGRGNKGKERDLGTKEDDWDGESFIPTYVYDAVKTHKRFDHMRGGQQEDAEEFFGFYLETLEEELLELVNAISPQPQKEPPHVEEREEDAPPEDDGWMEVGKKNKTVVTRTLKTTESPITRIFGGKFRSTLKAPGQKDSVTVEDWRSLRLDIQREQIHTIQDALSHISHPQSVQMTHPSRSGVTVEASQQVLIDALPPILVLHLKRFCYDTGVGGVVKVGKHIAFGPELEVRSDVMAPTARRAHAIRYKLFGVVYHHGLSAAGGHYTLDILHPNRYPSTVNTKPREAWVRIDDELVSDVRPDDVFAPPPDESRSAYLLFYRRIGVGK